MKVGEDVFLSPQRDACVVVVSEDGGVRVGAWSALGSDAAAAYAYRQTPPCLVEKGTVNPTLLAEGRPKRWGAAEGGDYGFRRSAIGIATGGRTRSSVWERGSRHGGSPRPCLRRGRWLPPSLT